MTISDNHHLVALTGGPQNNAKEAFMSNFNAKNFVHFAEYKGWRASGGAICGSEERF